MLLFLILLSSTTLSKEVEISNALTKNEEDLEISDSDKSYQYVAPPALLTVTPVISQRILTDSAKKYDYEGRY